MARNETLIKTEVVWEMRTDLPAMTGNQVLIKTEVVWEMEMDRPAVTGNKTLIKTEVVRTAASAVGIQHTEERPGHKIDGGEGAARG